jgi:hypothetical protein
MAAESFPAGRRSQAERPRNSERRPAIGKQCLALFARRTSDGGSDPACGKRGAKPRVEAALPLAAAKAGRAEVRMEGAARHGLTMLGKEEMVAV